MIRRRIPRKDDKAILELVELLLVPYARLTQPDLRVNMRTIRERLRPCETYVSVQAGRTPAGFIALRRVRDALYIDLLAVHPRSQGRGVGSRLLDRAERDAVIAGDSELRLLVDDTNVQAQRFYASKGYEPVQYNAAIRCYLLSKRLQPD